jgi:hypothetical protein
MSLSISSASSASFAYSVSPGLELKMIEQETFI